MRFTAAGTTDISDRAARLLGSINLNHSDLAGDGQAANSWAAILNAAGAGRMLGVIPALFNGTTWDRIRNLLAGAPRFSLAVGDAELAAVYGGSLYTVQIFENAPAAATNRVSLRLRNPVGSAERHVVLGFKATCNAARSVSFGWASPALADLANALAAVNMDAGGPAATAVASSQANLAGNPAVQVVEQQRLQVSVVYAFGRPVVLGANESCDVYFDSAGAVGDLDTVRLFWYEEAV